MDKKIFIDALECKEFKTFGLLEMKNLGKEVCIVGANRKGKSSILNAISWVLMGLDIYGNKLEAIKDGSSMSWVKVDATINDIETKTIRKIISLKKNGKTETTNSGLTDLDKELFYSIANPRYLQGLDPKNIKGIIAKAINIPTSIMNVAMESNISIYASEIEGEDSYAKIVAVENAIKNSNAEIKDLEKKILIEKGKIEALTTIKLLLAENGIKLEEDAETIVDINIDGADFLISTIENQIQEKKKINENYNAYRTAAYEVLATEFNNSMKKTQIKLLENGKEVFIITYEGKNIKTCSNSEQLLSGLEMINAFSEFTECTYPCLIDNAEGILDMDVDLFPNIKQFFFAIVADEKLSTWEYGDLTDIVTKKTTPRTKEQIKPTIKILDGWGSKNKS